MNDKISNLLQQIITDEGETFYRISNSEGKSWRVPAKNMHMGMNIYQPSSRNGRLLKGLLPLLHRVPLIQRVIHTEKETLSLCQGLRSVLERIFSCNNIDFSIFEGTPSINQKVTIQLSRGNEILGYCKVTDNVKTIAQFHAETALLQQLEKKGVTSVPRCLYCGALTDNISIFVQSSKKTQRSVSCHSLSKCHWDFAKDLFLKTQTESSFEDTDFANALKVLTSYLPGFKPEDREPVEKAIEMVQNHYKGKTVTFSAYHGDFTPWNTFVEKNRLFAFDLEYASMSCPPYMDICYFISQVALHKQKATPEEIYKSMEIHIADFPQEVGAPWLLCLSTLLYSLSVFFHLYDGKFNANLINYVCWVELVKIITQRHIL